MLENQINKFLGSRFTSHQVEEIKYSLQDLACAYIEGVKDAEGQAQLWEFKAFLKQKYNV